jgi:hypothetical protein
MHALFRSLDRGAEAGEALPDVWQTLAEAEIRFWRSGVTMIAGPPGSGKSVLGLQYAIQCKVPTLYISCDMGRFLTAVRAAAILTNQEISLLKREMATAEGREGYRRVIADQVRHLYIAYESRPTPEDIREIELSFEELWGIPPHALWIDNLMNLYSGSDSEWSGLRDLSQVFHWFAQELGAGVFLLHHTNLVGHDITKPAPMGGIKGQITELPELIVTTAKDGGVMNLCAVKNRHGRADPTGKDYVQLAFDETKGILRDIPKTPFNPVAQAPGWYGRTA